MYISFNISMEFVLHDVKFKYEDGVIYRWYEFKTIPDEWRIKKYNYRRDGYISIQFIVDEKMFSFKVHRLVYWLHNPDWDIFNNHRDNVIDHIDGNPRNNKIENLRVVTHQENQWNQVRAKGCSFRKDAGKWTAQIKVEKKMKHLGYFELEEDAHQAYLDAKKIYHII